MGSGKTFAGRVGVLGLVLIASACTQRTAPVSLPTAGSPPPRAVVRSPQPVFERPVAPQVQVRPAPLRQPPQRAFPRIGTLPPPNPNPVVADVGSRTPVFQSPQVIQQRAPIPRPVPRPAPVRSEIVDNPYKPFDPVTQPVRPRIEIAEAPLRAPEAADVPDAAEDNNPSSAPQSSDDYATLIDDNASEPEAARPSTAAQSEPAPRNDPAGAALGSGKALVALLVPESAPNGRVRAIADGLAKAASLAAADIGESQLELRKYDTGGDPGKAAQAAKNAIADGARLIIGPLYSGSAAAVRPIAQASNVNVIAFTTDSSVLGGGLYSIGFLPETDVNRIISYGASKGQRDIALLVPDSPFGGLVTREARNAAGKVGATIVKTQPYRDDFRALDAAAKEFTAFYEAAPNVDSIIMAASGKSLQGLASFLAFRDVLPTKVKYMGLGLWDDQETFREGTLRNGWFPGVDPRLKNDFAYRYGQAYGGEPPAISLLGYDAVNVAASLIRGGGFTQQALLSPTGFTGMSGLFRFRRDGRNERALSILSVGQGEFKVVDPAPRTFSVQVSSLIGG